MQLTQQSSSSRLLIQWELAICRRGQRAVCNIGTPAGYWRVLVCSKREKDVPKEKKDEPKEKNGRPCDLHLAHRASCLHDPYSIVAVVAMGLVT
jgi:hypothetical protein